jgi:hypothetical protein
MSEWMKLADAQVPSYLSKDGEAKLLRLKARKLRQRASGVSNPRLAAALRERAADLDREAGALGGPTP